MCETHSFSLGLGTQVGGERKGDSVGRGLYFTRQPGAPSATRTVSMMVFLYEPKWGCWEAGSGPGKTAGMVIIRQETGNGVVR